MRSKDDTPKSLKLEAKDERRMEQRCSICPPNKGENANRRPRSDRYKSKLKLKKWK